MDENQELKNRLIDAINQLAAISVLIDLSSEVEFTNLIEEIKRIQQIAVAYNPISADIFNLLLDGISYSKMDRAESLSDIITYSVSIIQEIFSAKREKEELTKYLEQIKNYLANVFKNDEAEKYTILPSQQAELQEFISNANSKLDTIEKEMLELEKDFSQKDKIETAFRCFHTLKGESGLVGLKNIYYLTHKVESILGNIRSQIIGLDKDVVSLILNIVDVLRGILFLLSRDLDKGLRYDISEIDLKIAMFLEKKGKANSTGKEGSESKNVEPQAEHITAETFVSKIPKLDLSEGAAILSEFITESEDHLAVAEEALLTLESAPQDSEAMSKIFREFHTIKGLASFLNLDNIRTLGHDTETMMDLVRKGNLELSSDITDAIFLAIDGMRKLLGLLNEQVSKSGVLKSPYYDISPIIKVLREIIQKAREPLVKELEKRRLGDILVEKGIINEIDLDEALLHQQKIQEKQKLGDILVDLGTATTAQIERGLEDQKKSDALTNTIKITVKKLDDLVDSMGELVITGSQVAQSPVISGTDDTRLIRDMAQLGRIIRDIQSVAMSMRLVTIRPLFQKMVRLVRDLSRKVRKDIDVRVSGEETEVDKNIIELIADPLVHMVRNAIDHGIENKEARLTKGKYPTGLIEMLAYHKGGNIVIEVRDDGRGLDKDKILKKARERGLIKGDAVLNDTAIFNMIFLPGFTTADKVTDVSGRGVGMDVVKNNVERLRGKIDVESEPDKGATFKLKLPLTLATIDGVILKVGIERYIIPIFSIEEFIKPKTEDITMIADKGSVIKIHDKLFQLVRFDDFFNAKYNSSDLKNLTGCLVNSDYGQACLLVDELLGQGQFVVKSIGEHLKNVKGIAGATILGDGKVGLILDIDGIVSLVT